MLFKYITLDDDGNETTGSIEAINKDVAISSLQRRGLIVASISSDDDTPFFKRRIKFLERVKNKEIVILSRQLATLFQAQVSALKIFRLLSEVQENPSLRDALEDMSTELQGGSSIAKALEKHDDIFSDFYINMVKAGEESGNLDETFGYLADYMDRTYALTSKAKNALVYPAFVIITFFAVMALMLTMVIPNIAQILVDSGQELPIYTKIVMGMSDFFVNYGFFFLIMLVVGIYMLRRYAKSETGSRQLAKLKLSLPYLGDLYHKLYLSRLSDNMHTMLASGIPMTRAIEITANIIDNKIYNEILLDAVESIKGGRSVSEALGEYETIPQITVQMIRVGEETGELGSILETLSNFYRREVETAVDSLVGLIEPAMILVLGLGVGGLLAAVLIPIYNVGTAI